MHVCSSKGEDEASSLRLELEHSLKYVEVKLTKTLQRNIKLEKDLIRFKEELNKSLKWTSTSNMLISLKQWWYGFVVLEDRSSFWPSTTNTIFFCVHYGHSDHLKKDYAAWKRTEEKFSNHFKQKKKNKDLGTWC